jgi:enoyl-CoA hydratase/carnithine racemase
MSDVLLARQEGGVLLLTLNRPESRNALSRDLVHQLANAILDADEDPTLRAIVLTGAGDKAFCAGADLKELRSGDQAGARYRSPMRRLERSVYEIVLECRKPTIAAMNGSALAGGFELALACDLRITHADALFGLPEVTIGMGANFGSVMLPKRISPTLALEFLMTGDTFTAARALEIGLVNRLVPPQEVLEASMHLARKIASNAPVSVRRVKAVALGGLDQPTAAALRQNPGADPYASEDRVEGIQARLEKRAPHWKNR